MSGNGGGGKARSLQDIMDEELARKMQEEENLNAKADGLPDGVGLPGEEQKCTPNSVPKSSSAFVEPDFVPPSCTKGISVEEAERIVSDEELARKLQAEEQDYLLALKLQRELDRQEELAACIPDLQRAKNASYASYDDCEEEDDYQENDDDGATYRTASQASSVAAGRRSRRRNKNKSKKKANAVHPQQRKPPLEIPGVPEEVPAAEEQLPLTETTVIQPTKHDTDVSARRNAATLDRFIDGSGLDGAPRGPEVRALHEDEFEEEEEDNHAIKSIPDRPYTAMREWSRKDEARRIRVKERTAAAQRKDAVMDEAAELTILGMVNQDIISELHGIISAGKEAHVYHAFAGDGRTEDGNRIIPEGWECALKVFKAVNEFKNRAIYLTPNLAEEFERAKQHPRACIKMWAQRELKNLQLLQKHGVRCPTPVGLFGDAVLLMEFLGVDGVPAPTLHEIDDRELKSRRWARLYRDCVLLTHRMFNCCGLVHGDLSEYNILFWDGKPYIIDVAQGVSVLHKDALEFLRRDCATLTTFFEKKGIHTLSADALYQFVQTNPVPAEKGVEDQEKEEKEQKKVTNPDKEDAEEKVVDADYDEMAVEALFVQMMEEKGEKNKG